MSFYKKNFLTLVLFSMLFVIVLLVCSFLVCTYVFDRVWNVYEFIMNPVVLVFVSFYILGSGFWLGYQNVLDEYNEELQWETFWNHNKFFA